MENFTDLVCPDCKNNLQFDEKIYSCQICHKDYPVVEGIPCFIKEKFYWAETKEELEKIIDISNKEGWHKALEISFKESRPQFFEGIIDKTRADFSYILPIDKQAKVLDLGAGWGSISISLAKQYKHVYALDAYYEKVRLLCMRSQQEKLENITCICSDGFKLPFADAYFDLVVLYGVLEWAGFVLKEESPVGAQTRLLQEVNRVLKKGGCAYICIENRCGIVYLLGYPDPHTGLRFITLLPRSIANIYSNLMHRGHYSAITHSLMGYKNILKASRFSEVEFYAPLPSYRKFYYLVPIEDSNIVKYFINNLARAQTRLSRFLLKLAKIFQINQLIKYLVPDYAIIAKK